MGVNVKQGGISVCGISEHTNSRSMHSMVRGWVDQSTWRPHDDVLGLDVGVDDFADLHPGVGEARVKRKLYVRINDELNRYDK